VRALKKEVDERLLVEAAQKDPARFAELYENNFERVYAYVVRRVGDRAETEDLTSEVFIMRWPTCENLSGEGFRLRRGCSGLRRI